MPSSAPDLCLLLAAGLGLLGSTVLVRLSRRRRPVRVPGCVPPAVPSP